MEKRGRKREDKVRFVVAMSPDIILNIKNQAKQLGKNASVFLEEIILQNNIGCYNVSRYNRHERKDVCYRLSQSTIENIRTIAIKDNVTHEMIIEAMLNQYLSSPLPLLEKVAPIAVQYITTKENKDVFFDTFKRLCVAFGTEDKKDKECIKSWRIIVGQKLTLRCVRCLTDLQINELNRILEDFSNSNWSKV